MTLTSSETRLALRWWCSGVTQIEIQIITSVAKCNPFLPSIQAKSPLSYFFVQLVRAIWFGSKRKSLVKKFNNFTRKFTIYRKCHLTIKLKWPARILLIPKEPYISSGKSNLKGHFRICCVSLVIIRLEFL